MSKPKKPRTLTAIRGGGIYAILNRTGTLQTLNGEPTDPHLLIYTAEDAAKKECEKDESVVRVTITESKPKKGKKP